MYNILRSKLFLLTKFRKLVCFIAQNYTSQIDINIAWSHTLHKTFQAISEFTFIFPSIQERQQQLLTFLIFPRFDLTPGLTRRVVQCHLVSSLIKGAGQLSLVPGDQLCQHVLFTFPLNNFVFLLFWKKSPTTNNNALKIVIKTKNHIVRFTNDVWFPRFSFTRWCCTAQHTGKLRRARLNVTV